MNVFVLGHRGMLGHVVARYLGERGHKILTTETRYSGGPDDELVKEVRESEADWIINCIGKIPQKTTNPAELYQGNFQLPVHVKRFLRADQRMLHASTDCVFSGKRGNYRVEDIPDPYDHYGLSKLLGESIAEAGRCQIIRTSIIGPELGGGKGLMAWFLSQKGPVNGFTNHWWNGITTLEWAKLADEILTGKLNPPGALFQAGSVDTVTKYELLKLIGEVWPHTIQIDPTAGKDLVNRTLVPTMNRGELKAQLQSFRDWYTNSQY